MVFGGCGDLGPQKVLELSEQIVLCDETDAVIASVPVHLVSRLRLHFHYAYLSNVAYRQSIGKKCVRL